MAITNSLALDKWYKDTTSRWTLDYPPLFAWYEYILSRFAKLFDPQMLSLTKLNYASQETVLFQRLTVMVGDLVLFYAIRKLVSFILAQIFVYPCAKLLFFVDFFFTILVICFVCL